MGSEETAFAVLKMFLGVGPLLGFGVLELILLRRDRRRAAAGLPLVPVRFAASGAMRQRPQPRRFKRG